MSLKKRVLIRALAIAMSLMMMAASAVTLHISAETGEDVSFTKKIVSVVYDDSGSMRNAERYLYAQYAIQMLMALLGENDTLVIVPMNRDIGYEVDLASADRGKAISDIMALKYNVGTNNEKYVFDIPDGGQTPIKSVDTAIGELKERGLKDGDHLAESLENTEHWLVILTDGEFGDAPSTEKGIETRISAYPSLKTIFLGIEPQKSYDMSNSSLSQKYAFTGYKTDSADGIIDAMQNIANQLSGRYTLEALNYTVNGSKVTVDLDKSGVALKSVSAILQNSDAKVVSAEYNGKTLPVKNSCIINVVNTENKNQPFLSGASAVINGDPFLSGGKLTVNFSKDITEAGLSILAEPALEIVSYLEYNNGGKWERATAQYVNANLTDKDRVKIGYDVYEKLNNTKVDIEKLFGKTESSVTYAGKSYQIGEEIQLEVGNNEISVSVSVMNGAYKMYDSFTCIVEKNPTFYRVEAEHGDRISSASNNAEIIYTVFLDNKPIASASELSGYTYEVNVTAPNGQKTKGQANIQSDGKIKANIEAVSGVYGQYKVDFKIFSPYGISRECQALLNYTLGDLTVECNSPDTVAKGENRQNVGFTVFSDGNKLTASEVKKYTLEAKFVDTTGKTVSVAPVVEDDGTVTCTVNIPQKGYGSYEVELTVSSPATGAASRKHILGYYPSAFSIEGGGRLSLSQYEIKNNSKPFEFVLTADGVPIPFDDGMISFKITADGTDVTSYALSEGNKLSYIPRADQFGKELSVGEKTVSLTVTCPAMPELSCTAAATLDIVNTVCSVTLADISQPYVDRFALDITDAALYFTVSRDGVPLTASELQSALDAGDLKLAADMDKFVWKLLPCKGVISVEEINGNPYVAYSVKKDFIKPLDSFAGMLIFNGGKEVTLTYRDAGLTENIIFEASHWWSYVWRILVILLIIHIILWIIGFFKCKNLPSGFFVTVYDGGDEFTLTPYGFNLSWRDRNLWRFKQLIPWFPGRKKLWYHQPSKRVNSSRLTFKYNDSGQAVFKFSKEMNHIMMEENDSDADRIVNQFKNKLKNYKNIKPRIERPLTPIEARRVFRLDTDSGLVFPKNEYSYERCYGEVDGRKVVFATFFVKHNKSRY